jgi:hypothetical protein
LSIPGIDFTEVRSRSPFHNFGSLQRDFHFPGLPVFLYWTNERKRYKEK